MIVCFLNSALCQHGRILEEKETDPTRLRSLSGAWFTEERSKRHRSRSGSSLVGATIRHRKTKNRGLFAVNTPPLGFYRPAGACFPAVVWDGISQWWFCGCCYGYRCGPDWAVQWRERGNLPQRQHVSWGWEKTEGQQRRGEQWWNVMKYIYWTTEDTHFFNHLSISIFCYFIPFHNYCAYNLDKMQFFFSLIQIITKMLNCMEDWNCQDHKWINK